MAKWNSKEIDDRNRKADRLRLCNGKYMPKLGGFDLMDQFGVKIKKYVFNKMKRFDFIKL